MSEHVETAELAAFAKTVETSSLSRAALELGVPRATVSRRLSRLEERLGTRLLRRTTRSLKLTDSGETLYRHARIVLDAVHSAEASVRHAEEDVRGDLRVSVPPFSMPSFFEMIATFARDFPSVRLHVHSTTKMVDLKRDGYDVAVRATEALEPGLIARTIFKSPLICVASAEYLRVHGTPKTRKDLRNHRCLMGFARGEVAQTHWPAGRGRLKVDGAFFANDMNLLANAAAAGLGLAVLPLQVARPLVAEGRLKRVLADEIYADAKVSVVYLEREFLPAQVREFVARVQLWGQQEIAAGAVVDQIGAPPTKRARKGTRSKKSTST